MDQSAAAATGLEFLLSRRSATSSLGGPPLSREAVDQILRVASTVPDHGGLKPFRFVVVEEEGRGRFGDALAKTAAERRPELPAVGLEKIRAKAFRSPTIIVLISSPKAGKIETWEQNATAACAGYAIVLAAHALNIGAVWKSVPFTKGKALSETLAMSETEEVLGWIHLGTPTKPDEAPEPRTIDVATVTTVLDGDGAKPYRGP